MQQPDLLDISLLAESIGFQRPFFATRDAIQVADLGEGDHDLARGTVRVLEVLTDAKNKLLLDHDTPERPTEVAFETTTLAEPQRLVLTLTWHEDQIERLVLDIERSPSTP